MVEAIFAALAAGLGLWKSIESRKYIDRLIKLKKEYHDEWNKPEAERSDAVLDDIVFQLCLISSSFAARVEQENAQNK